MECQTCQMRSAIGYCDETRVLVCEDCSVNCDVCNRLIARARVNYSKKGKGYCSLCWEERLAQRAAHRKDTPGGPQGPKESLAFSALQDEGAIEAAIEADERRDAEVALVASAWQPPPPWRLGMYAAALGAVAILVVLFVPGFRRIPLSDGSHISTPYVLLVLPALAICWSAWGIFTMDYQSDKAQCLIAIGIALLTIPLCIYADASDPASTMEDRFARMQLERDQMNARQLMVWRQQVLSRHME